ncbi:unnamed protein product [Durusdinium trenchii]|uniref:Uncharacterized protein n=3 Tax=Durusdinium trenchii TaxID=1381693 RepID=A0ABP0LJ90_9DINO
MKSFAGRAAPSRNWIFSLRLDVRIRVYLRRVHHFCFYSAQWFKDEWELRERCGTATLRETSTVHPSGGERTRRHEANIKDFLAKNVSLQRPQVILPEDQDFVKHLAQAAEHAMLTMEQKVQCRLCSKYFKSPDHVRKHLNRSHLDWVEAHRKELHQVMAEKAWWKEQGDVSL